MSVAVFRKVSFGSVRRLSDVWNAPEVPELPVAPQIANRLDEGLERIREGGEKPLGLVILGPAGSGKTHALGQVRRRAMESGAHFVLIDCSDVRDFWSVLALQYLQALQQEYRDSEGVERRQIDRLLTSLIELTGSSIGQNVLPYIRDMRQEALIDFVEDIVRWVRRRGFRRLAERHGTIRALFYLYSDQPTVTDIGYHYLQGVALDDSEAQRLSLTGPNSARDVVCDLARLLAVSAPTVLAFDQIDPIVAEHHQLAMGPDAATKQPEAVAIINNLANGLMSLGDLLEKTLVVVSSLESSWDALRKWALNSALDRFSPPFSLSAMRDRSSVEALVLGRMEPAYRKQNWQPPYPTWPFRPRFFEELPMGLTPREVLKRCEQHRQQCVDSGSVIELESYMALASAVAPPPAPLLGQRFEELRKTAETAWMLDEEKEDAFGDEIAEVCQIFFRELPQHPAIDYQLESEFHETKQYESLHVRLRRIFRAENDREEHICLRVLNKKHWKAFVVRLRAAMTMSGIAPGLGCRGLVILRNAPPPGGRATEVMLDEFLPAGGKTLPLAPAELAVFAAVRQLEKEFPEDFDSWIRREQPLSKTSLFRALFGTWMEPRPMAMAAAAGVAVGPPPPLAPVVTPPKVLPTIEASPVETPIEATGILVGVRDGDSRTPIAFPAVDLTRHTVIRAGSGGGKTVLLKRLVEEAALAGISSIVIDSARDLSYLGDAWPEEPSGWLAGDAERATRYRNAADVRIWTPGRRDGRPMFLSPIPDFRTPFDDPSELDKAVNLTVEGLGALLVKGRNATHQGAILRKTVEAFAKLQGHTLEQLVEQLRNLPESAQLGIKKEDEIAAAMGDNLRALMVQDPLLSGAGEPVDPGKLLGADSDRPVVSVVSLFAINDQAAQAAFIARLAMAVFNWIRRNPARGGVRGLFVLDEAAPFLPGKRGAESKAALLLLCQQARKYGLGMLLATQNPMDLDYNATAQFSTQFFGKANQPQVIKYIEEAMAQRGLRNLKPSQLKDGQFYVASPSLSQPVKIQAPMCLSWHPHNRTPTDEEILERVRRC